MADNELDTFLGAENEPVPDAVEELLGVPSEPEQQQEQAAAPEPEKTGDDDEPAPVGTMAALQDERNKRRDWKEKAVRAETERDELRKQLEEAKRFAQQPPPPQQYHPPQQPQQYIPDPTQDPRGFIDWQQRQLLNERLNMSQIQVQREFGAEVVAAAAAEFKAAMVDNPALEAELHQQIHPYDWVMQQVQKGKPEGWLKQQVEVARMRRELEADPAGFRAKLRAEFEAEMNATQPAAPINQAAPVSPAARLNPSLANVRSAAPRASGAWAGETPLKELFRNG